MNPDVRPNPGNALDRFLVICWNRLRRVMITSSKRKPQMPARRRFACALQARAAGVAALSPLSLSHPMGEGRGEGCSAILLMIGLLDLIEDSAICEVDFLRLLPATEDFINGEQSQFRKIRRVLLRDGLQPRAVVVPGDDFLAFR